MTSGQIERTLRDNIGKVVRVTAGTPKGHSAILAVESVDDGVLVVG